MDEFNPTFCSSTHISNSCSCQRHASASPFNPAPIWGGALQGPNSSSFSKTFGKVTPSLWQTAHFTVAMPLLVLLALPAQVALMLATPQPLIWITLESETEPRLY